MSSTVDSALSSIAAELKRVAATCNETEKRRLMVGLRDLQLDLESPEETMKRLLVGENWRSLTTVSVRVSLDLKIFNLLDESKEPLSVAQLAQQSESDPILLARLLRHQSSLGFIKEIAQDSTQQVRQQNTLRIRKYRQDGTSGKPSSSLRDSATHTMSLQVTQPRYAWPSIPGVSFFLCRHELEESNGSTGTPFVRGRKSPFFEYLHHRERDMTWFHDFMKAMQYSTANNSFGFVTLDEEAKGWPAEQTVFVDVGGGTGQQCIALRQQYPSLTGKVILQDLPAAIAQAKVPDDIEAMAHDFFTPQPIKGAKFYYLCHVLHDHPDDKCLKILKHIAEAMSDDSVLLLEEIVVPNEKVSWYVTQFDLAMMMVFGSQERTEAAWKELLSKSGLTLRSIVTYVDSNQLSVIRATK